MDEDTKQFMQLQINALKNLPVLPEASLKILEAINTPDISIDRLTAVLSLSPSLVARLLGLANSAYFARGKSITDIRTAIFQVLGLDLVKGLALGVVLNVQLDAGKCQAFNSEYFWMRSLMTAVSAQKLSADCPKLNDYSSSMIYTSGLLLNIGVLVLGYIMPDQLNNILQENQKNQIIIHEEISKQFGQSHFQLGAVLLKKWQLPELYQTVLHQFEHHEFDGPEKPLLTLLQLCQRLSAIMANGEEPEITSFEDDCHAIDLSLEKLTILIEQMIANHQAIQQLAFIMGN